MLWLSAAEAYYGIGTTSSYQRLETLQSDYLTGYLTWNGGRGGISWSSSPSGGTDPIPISGWLNFTSDPLPRNLPLNVSHHIQLDLVVKLNAASGNPNCPRRTDQNANVYYENDDAGVMAKLSVGDNLFAGRYDRNLQISYNPPPTYQRKPSPIDPPGYAVCRYRMPAEVSMLAEGTVLTLQLQLHSGVPPQQLGAAGNHRSVIRFAHYSPDENFYRNPQLTGSDPYGLGGSVSSESERPGEQDDSAAFVGAGGLGAGLLVGAVRTRGARRRGAFAACSVLLVASIGLAGCLSGASKRAAEEETAAGPDGGLSKADNVIQAVDDLALAGADYGSILGQVHDDLHVPVRGAHVSLVGLGTFADADGYGRFAFKNLAPRCYTLRYDADGFRSLEAESCVKPGHVTRVNVLLVPTTLRAADFRRHVHDYWLGAERRVAMDADLGTVCTNINGGLSCQPSNMIGLPPAAPGDTSGAPNTIVPGTYEVEVAVTWDAAKMGIPTVGLMFQANEDPSPNNWSLLYPRASGLPFRIASNWEMDDVGHQPHTTWKFLLYPGPGVYPTCATIDVGCQTEQRTSTPETTPRFHVRVTLQKGVVPLEPPHTDHWGSAMKLRVARGVEVGASWTTEAVNLALTAFFGIGLLIWCGSPAHWALGGVRDTFFWTPHKVIPPGTKWVEVALTQNRASGVGPAGHFDWHLWYKPNNSPAPAGFSFPNQVYQHNAAVSAVDRNNPGWVAGPTPQGNTDGTKHTWRIPLPKDELADSIYSKKSAWGFALFPSDQTQACIDAHEGAALADLQVQWIVTAHKDAMT